MIDPEQLAKNIVQQQTKPVEKKTVDWFNGNLMVWCVQSNDPHQVTAMINGFARRRRTTSTQMLLEQGDKPKYTAFVYFIPKEEDILSGQYEKVN